MASTSITFNYESSAIRYRQVSDQTRYLLSGRGDDSGANRLTQGPNPADFQGNSASGDILSLGNQSYQNIHEETMYEMIQEKVSLTIKGNFSDEEVKDVEQKFKDLVKDYFSPEAVAGRIVDFATGFFDAYAARGDNAEKPKSEVIDGFEKLIRGAIDEGFSQARKILGDVFSQDGIPDKINETVDQTYTEVQKGLQNFFDRIRKELLESLPPELKTIPETGDVAELQPQYQLTSTN